MRQMPSPPLSAAGKVCGLLFLILNWTYVDVPKVNAFNYIFATVLLIKKNAW